MKLLMIKSRFNVMMRVSSCVYLNAIPKRDGFFRLVHLLKKQLSHT